VPRSAEEAAVASAGAFNTTAAQQGLPFPTLTTMVVGGMVGAGVSSPMQRCASDGCPWSCPLSHRRRRHPVAGVRVPDAGKAQTGSRCQRLRMCMGRARVSSQPSDIGRVPRVATCRTEAIRR
jgi:hypothetical protein